MNRGCLTIAGYILALATWNGYTNNPVKFNSDNIKQKTATSAQWAGDLESKLKSAPNVPKLPDVIETKYGPLKTKDIPFEGDFVIHTERYSLIKDEDSWPEQAIGFAGSISSRIFFWDSRIGHGTDSRGAKRVLAMLENDKSIDGLTVRLNHNRALYDLYRIFSDPALKERNNWLARAAIGIPMAVKDELWAGLFRGAYYNPMSKTAVSYADIDAITFHEVGHGKDFSRFDQDWVYSLSRMIPPVMLYQEAKASIYAKEMLAPEENFQFYRFLLPAFGTYLLVTYGATKRFVKRRILGIRDEQASDI